MLNRDNILASFDRALREINRDGKEVRLRPRSVAHQAHKIYCADLGPAEKRPSPETFRKFATGRLAIPEIVHSLKSSDVRSADRARLDRKRVRNAFQKAVKSLSTQRFKGRAKPSLIARRAYEIYLRDEKDAALRPSHHSFQRLIYGKAADPEIVDLLDAALKKQAELFEAAVPSARRARLDRKRVRAVFQKAAVELEADLMTGRAKLRDVARLARALYLRDAGGAAPEPSLSAFERLLYGKGAEPEIKALYQPFLTKRSQEIERIHAARAAKGPALKRVRLDRERLRRVFQEAARRLEASVVRGQIRPLQVARRAYALYNLESDQEASKPSPHTFHRLIYGKSADPEIMTLIKTALKGED